MNSPPVGRPSRFGPGLLVAAAFIGPGTVTAATQAGAKFGVVLLWAVLFGTVATIVLQEMAARLGIIGRLGLGEALRQRFASPLARLSVASLVVAAIGFGNAAYQTGNLTGAAVGAGLVFGGSPALWASAIAVVAALLLVSGRYRIVAGVLMGLVGVMSLTFLTTALLVRPDPTALVQGAFVPRIPDGSLTTILALVGTTIVPYNLFLHAASVQEHWRDESDSRRTLAQARRDTLLSVGIGGAITAAIVVTAAGAYGTAIEGSPAADAATTVERLTPILGRTGAAWLIGCGLLAAGASSAITAPLAAGYAICGMLGLRAGLTDLPFRAIALTVMSAGTIAAILAGKSPSETIVIAQAANALLLPLIAIFLLVVMNHTPIVGSHRNRIASNVAGAAVVGIVILLAAMKLLSLVGLSV
ncbi:MAG TPA: manganese transporter [Planctomycetaceae bacterium]|nr:manganese transporter [Planctomycetaceae bacterium]HRF01412.1 Nramp family divalent metal transporter [Pirellulaceae bacterium]